MTVSDKPRFAPGCFGSALGYGEDRICKSCPFAEQCLPVHLKAKEELRRHFNVEAPDRRTPGALTRKAEKLMQSFGKTAEEVRASLLAGVNPYPLNKGYMGVVCQFLLAAKRPLSLDELTCLLATSRSLTLSSSRSYTLVATSILRHCGVFKDESAFELRQG